MKSIGNPIPEIILQRILSTNFKQKGYQVINQCTDDPTKFDDITECRTHDIFWH